MKTTLQILFLAFLFLPNSSCLNKEPLSDGNCTSGCIVFIGQVSDINGEPLTAEILIKHRQAGVFGFEQLVGELETDEEGNFDFRFDGTDFKTNEGFFTISAYKIGYITDSFEGNVTYYNIDSTNFDLPNISNITLSPSATIDLDINIDSPPNITSFCYNFIYINRATGYCIPNDSLSTAHNYTHIVGGDQSVLLKYNYKRLGTLLEFEESILIEGGETKKVEIDIN